MKKTILSLVISLIILISLQGCNSNPAEKLTEAPTIISSAESNSSQQDTVKTTNKSTITSQTSTEHDKAINLSLQISSRNYKNKQAKISYPQITNFSDLHKQNQINDLIKNDIINNYKKDVTDVASWFYDNNYQNAEDDLTEEVNYEVKLNSSNLLSIIYFKYSILPKSAHGSNTLHSININIGDGSILKFKDIIIVDNSFVEKLKNDKSKLLTAKAYPGQLSDGLDLGISSELQGRNNKDLIDMFNSDDYSFYLTKDSIGMNIDTAHAGGDYICFVIKYSDIKDNIKPGTKYLKGLIK